MKPIAVAVLLVACGSIAWGSVAQGAEADSLEIYMQGLQHQAPGVRRGALAKLVELPDSTAALMDKVRTGRLTEVLPVAWVLMSKGERASSLGEPLVALISNPAIEGWRWDVAVQLLRKVAPAKLETVVSELTNALSRDAFRIHSALLALQDLGPKASSAQLPLLHLLERGHAPLAGVLVNALCIETQTLSSTQPQWLYDDLLILETLKKVGGRDEMLLPRLTRLTQYEHRSVRMHAALQLSRMGAEAQQLATKTLIQLLDDDHLGVREEAILGLRRLKTHSPEVVTALIPMLERPEAKIRLEAVKVLSDMGPAAKESLPALQRATQFQRLIDPNGPDVPTYETALKNVQGQ